MIFDQFALLTSSPVPATPKIIPFVRVPEATPHSVSSQVVSGVDPEIFAKNVIRNKNVNEALTWVLRGAYDYYYSPRNGQLLSDATYNALCDLCSLNWPTLENKFKEWVTPQDLISGSFMNWEEEAYPKEIRLSAIRLKDLQLKLKKDFC
jgi:hypothetical protein